MPTSGSVPTPPSIGKELSVGAVTREVALFLVVPAVLLLVFNLPLATRERLVFEAGAPSIVTAFTTHYVHLSASHLLGNLAVYVGAVVLGYPLALLGGVRRLYVPLVLTVLIVYPFVLSGLHLSLIGRGGLLGFSGIALALVGLLPIVLFSYLRARIEGAVSINDAPALFFFGMAAIAWRSPTPGPPIGPTVVISVVLGVLYLVPLAARIVSGPSQRGVGLYRRGFVELPVAAVLLYFLAIALGFPVGPTTPGSPQTNVVVHLLAYALGFIGAYLTERFLRALGPPAPAG